MPKIYISIELDLKVSTSFKNAIAQKYKYFNCKNIKTLKHMHGRMQKYDREPRAYAINLFGHGFTHSFL